MPTLPEIDHDLRFTIAEEPKVFIASFGDGYSQRAARGINNIAIKVDLVWSFEDLTNADALLAFFRARNGAESFDYQLPQEDSARTWICPKWNNDTVAAGVYTVSATFQEVFDQ